jgi:carbamoyltransferase
MRILGISPFHDSSVAIINDGQIEYFSKEERLTRKKRDRLGLLSLKKADDYKKGHIDYIVITSPWFDDPYNNKLELYFKKKYPNTPVLRMCNEHHLSHASLAFYNSGFDKCLTAVIDRNGSKFERLFESESIFISEYPNKFTPIYKSYCLDKIGINEDFLNFKKIKEITKDWPDCDIKADSTMNITKVYESATTFIGQHCLENGKTMGLSSYGKDKPFKKLFVDGLPNSNLFVSLNDDDNSVLLKSHLDKKTNKVTKENYEQYADYAYQVQTQTKEEVLDLIKKYVNKTNIKKVCITGGYGLNVVTNEYLIKNLPDVDFYFEPLADDTGNSLGSAMYIYRDKTKDISRYPLKHTFFNNVKEDINIDGRDVTIREIANHLDKGKIVAVYNGQSEAGPRALGNRSILFDPRNANAKEIVNKVKNREWYRPFAGSVLKEDMADYFETHHIKDSPFMTISFQSKTNKIPGITHVDNSCRIQSVDRDISHFYELLNEFKSITNVSVLLNTSFNMAGEALVETVSDAINTFKKTDIDILWFPEINKMMTK